MQKKINLEDWNRKPIYDFYKNCEDPFFNITANVGVSQLYNYCKQKQVNFFLASLFFSIKVVNNIPPFRYRILDDAVVEYERVHPGSTVLMDDNTFRYCYFEYVDDLDQFVKEGQEKIIALKANKVFDPGHDQLQMIHYSTIPWVSFTSFKHARHGGNIDSIPKIVFGKYFDQDGKKWMPVSVAVNHALMDGYHVGLLFEELQRQLNAIGC